MNQKLITKHFTTEALLNSYISSHGITRDNINYQGYSGGMYQLSYWSY
jgi:hypothetical protein